MMSVFSTKLSTNPFETASELRKEGALVRQKIPIFGKIWLTTDQDIAARVLKDNETFRVRKPNGQAVGLQWWMPKSIRLLATNMLSMDEPEHRRLRSIVDQSFRREAILALEPRIELIANDMASELFASDSNVDIVSTFARHLPLAVICELLGLPKKDRQQFAKWAEGFTKVNGMIDFLKLIPRLGAMTKYLQSQIDEIRVSGGEGLIAELISTEHDDGALSNDELIAMVFLLLVAGHETTTHLISGGLLALLQNPDQMKWLREDLSRLDLAVEELLRFVTPVQLSKPRYATQTVTIENVTIEKGELVMTLLTASNYDPELFSEPESLKLDRKPNRHMSFGSGIHFCLGHQLARMEGKHAFKALLTQYPELQLAKPDEEIKWLKRIGLNALEQLIVKKS